MPKLKKNMDFCERLKNLRKQAGFTQSDFAEKTGVHFQTISKWERGASMPDISMLSIIANVLSVSLETLVGEKESDTPITGNFDLKAMSTAIASYRKKAGLSQAETAEKLSVTSDIVSKWERGVTTPDIDLLIKLANLFGVSLSILYYGITPDYTPEKKVFYTKSRRKWMIISAVCLSVALTILSATLFILSTPKTFTVAVQNGESYKVVQGTAFTPPVPQKSGYSFVKWVNEGGEEVKIPCDVQQNLTLIAVFTPIEYTVDYWVNGGILQGEVQTIFTVESGEIVLPLPQKQNDEFLGWYLTPDYSGESVTSLVCNAQNVSVYAKWQQGVYTVRYELGGGIMTDNPQTVTASEQIVLQEPVKSGYKFLGWFTSLTGGEKVEAVGGENAQNLTLYAVWQKIDLKYQISYELSGGSVSGENPTVVPEGESYKLLDAQKTGYDFLGWNDSPTANGNYYDWITGEKDLTLYAIFKPKQIIIRYEYQGIYQEEANPSFITYGEEVVLNSVILGGYDFIGWYDSEVGGNKIEVISPQNLLNLSVLYARFTPKVFNFTLNANGGTFVCENQTYTQHVLRYEYGSSVALPTCQKTNYTFIGWADENGKIHTELNTTNYQLTVLYAHFYYSAGCKINYITNGGEIIGDAPDTIYAGESFYLPNCEKENCTFLGWNDSETGEGNWYVSSPEPVCESVNLYAIYQEVFVNASSEDFEYQKGATQVILTKYTGDKAYTGRLILPTYIEGLPVTKLEEYLFANCLFSEVVLPDELVEIAFSAFACCENLTTVTFNNNLKIIGDLAFTDCSKLTSAILPNTVTHIGDNAFFNCSHLQSVVMPTSLISIGDYAFRECIMIETIELFEGLTTISEGAFLNCASLIKINLPNSLTELGDKAFQGCVHLTKISLPSGLRTVGVSTFQGCETLSCVELPSTITTIDMHAFDGCFLLKSINIPSGVTTIGGYAFHFCFGLQTINIPNSVTTIGACTFTSCAGLTSIKLPKNLTSIGGSAFEDCINLTSIELPDNLTTIGAYAFKNCEKLSFVVIGSKLKTVNWGAFMDCTALTTVYYKGAQSDWQGVSIDSENECLTTNATIYYYSETQPEIVGNYWYYDQNGNIAVR